MIGFVRAQIKNRRNCPQNWLMMMMMMMTYFYIENTARRTSRVQSTYYNPLKATPHDQTHTQKSTNQPNITLRVFPEKSEPFVKKLK